MELRSEVYIFAIAFSNQFQLIYSARGLALADYEIYC